MQLTRAQTGRRRRHSARPRFDHLEERTLLSTWTVTDNSDNPTDTGSLRYAILNEPGGTTINFAPSVSSPITLTHGALNITANLDIEGPGADMLAVDGNHGSTVFTTAPGVTATIAGLTITGGKASQGGGILNKGTLTVEGCMIANNRAPSGQGGGILNKGTLTLTDSTVANNRSASGGGMDNSPGATASLTNCTVAYNSVRRTGGGITSRGALTLVNCTVAANSAKSGGGVFHEGASGPLILANTIVAGDRLKGAGGSGPDECGRARSLGHNLLGRTAGGSGWVKTDELRVQPLLDPLADNGGPTPTMALEPGSRADAAGSTSIPGVTVPKIDQRGALREGGLDAGAVDIGAFQASSTYLVTSTADSGDVGTLRAAVSWANTNVNINKLTPTSVAIPAPNTIVFDTSGVFKTPQTITLSPALGSLFLTNTKTPEAIAGPGASVVTVSGGDKVGVFRVTKGVTATFAGLTITHGNATLALDSGGGILNESGTVTVTNCTVSHNSGDYGGAIRNDSGTFTLMNSTVSDNSSIDTTNGFNYDGGGVFNDGTMTIISSALSNNSGAHGGAIENYDGPLTITNSTLSGNSASDYGGGIDDFGLVPVTITNSTLSGNSAQTGGGGIRNAGTVTITNSTLSGNSAPIGGGVWNWPSHNLVVANSIIAGNVLTGSGGSGPDGNGKFNSLGNNLIGNTAGSSGWVSTDLQNVNPLLGALADNGGPTQTMALMSGSPALGAGNVAVITNPPFPGPPFTDQRGFPRIVNGKVDIGAYQTQ